MDGVTVSSCANLGTARRIDAFAEYYNTFGGTLSVKASVLYIHQRSQGTISGQRVKSTVNVWNFLGNALLTVSKRHGWRLGALCKVTSPMDGFTIARSWTNHLSAYVEKVFPGGASLKLEANDLLGNKDNTHYTSDNYSYRNRLRWSGRSVALAFSVPFGKSQVQGAMPHSSTALEERTKR